MISSFTTSVVLESKLVSFWKNVFFYFSNKNFKTCPQVFPPKYLLVLIYRLFIIIFLEATYNTSNKNNMAISHSIIYIYSNFALV